jgi:hypothetical protein
MTLGLGLCDISKVAMGSSDWRAGFQRIVQSGFAHPNDGAISAFKAATGSINFV